MEKKIFDINDVNKRMLLGTALWGWGVEKKQAFSLLDTFVQAGGTVVDTATNYPINKKSSDYGLAVSWLSEWLKKNRGSNLSVLVKIGSVNNIGGPEFDLNQKKIRETISNLKRLLGENLFNISIHWDNRGEEESEVVAVKQTIEVLHDLYKEGYGIGLSGIKFPSVYAQFVENLRADCWVQVKENISTNAARLHYQPYFPDAKYIAYGINLGGLKETAPKAGDSYALRNLSYPIELVEQLRAFLKSQENFGPIAVNFYELALLLAYCNPNLYGVIVGARNSKQLVNSLEYWKRISKYEEEKRLPNYSSLVQVIKSF